MLFEEGVQADGKKDAGNQLDEFLDPHEDGKQPDISLGRCEPQSVERVDRRKRSKETEDAPMPKSIQPLLDVCL